MALPNPSFEPKNHRWSPGAGAPNWEVPSQIGYVWVGVVGDHIFAESGRKLDASKILGCLCRIHRSPIGVWERIGHSTNISSLQPKTIESIMMFFDVPSSKMQEERSNKVLNSSNGPFSVTFVCPHTCYKKSGGSRNPKRKKCTDNISIMLAPWSPKPESLEGPFQALFGKYTHTSILL